MTTEQLNSTSSESKHLNDTEPLQLRKEAIDGLSSPKFSEISSNYEDISPHKNESIYTQMRRPFYAKFNFDLHDTSKEPPEWYKKQQERIKDLEEVCSHLNNQMKIMKKLISVQMKDLKRQFEEEVFAIKHTQKQQQMLLEQQIREIQLVLKSVALNQSKSLINVTRMMSPEQRLESLQTPNINSTWATHQDETIMSPSFYLGEKRVDDDMVDQEKIATDPSYVLYVYEATSKGRNMMTKNAYIKFMRDCKLKLPLKECNFEMMWIRILRALGLVDRENMNHQNNVELTLEQFKIGLIQIANQVFKDDQHFTEAQKLESLILTYLIPFVQPKLKEIHNVQQKTSIIQSAMSAEIENLFKQYRKQLKELYEKFCVKQRITQKIEGMALNGLLSFCKKFGLLPLITKTELSAIFTEKTKRSKKKDSDENLMTYKQFESTLIDVANSIYGGKPFSDNYPTPESRLRKLFSKIFVIQNSPLKF